MFYLCALPNKYSRSCKALHRFIDVRVRRAIKKVERESSMGGIKTSPQYKEQADPSTRYLFIDEMAKQLKDPQRISGEVQNVFFAARDNVAFATANTLFQCARNPHVWTDLRETALDLGEQPLTFELLRSLKTFRYVYNETLRFQGPPINATRTAMKNSILPTGGGPSGNAPIFVEKGTAVWSLPYCFLSKLER